MPIGRNVELLLPEKHVHAIFMICLGEVCQHWEMASSNLRMNGQDFENNIQPSSAASERVFSSFFLLFLTNSKEEDYIENSIMMAAKDLLLF